MQQLINSIISLYDLFLGLKQVMNEKERFLKKFEDKLRAQLDEKALADLAGGLRDDIDTADYETFRNESLPATANIFERACNFSEKILNIKPDKKSEEKISQNIYAAHLSCTPTGVMSLTVISSLLTVMLGTLAFIAYSTTIGVGLLIVGMALYFVIQTVPSVYAKRFKSKSSDEVIIAIFYIVAYMRFNSNFELAVGFAANYLNSPLALDFKRLLWKLNNAEYPSLKVAFDEYLEDWREDNLEFLEAIYLIESSLFESEDFRRISLLDKSLDLILQGNYEKMLHFAQDLREKVQTFNMIGVVLPILGLIILPLAASFGDPKSTWELVFILYNILFPIGVAYFAFNIIYNRPSGTNSIRTPKNLKDLIKLQKYPLKFGKKTFYLSPGIPALTILILFLAIGIAPVLIHTLGSSTEDSCMTSIELALNANFASAAGGADSPFGFFQEYRFLDVDGGPSYCYGPYGTYPGLISLFIPLSIAFSAGYYLKIRYKNLVHIRDRTKNLEKEFPSATFQLGNRINEGLSAELAFGAVAETMKGTETGEFYSAIDSNIKFNGMSVEKAIFDPEKGAINVYPSDLIVSSMKILIRAIEKGPEITAKTLIDLSRYLSEIHMANERMKDLLAESIGSMKGQANFLAPMISGVVISIVALVSMIMNSLSKAVDNPTFETAGASAASFLGESIPTYLFQSVVGIYIVALIAILVFMTTNLENGDDIIFTRYSIGEKLISSMTKYAIIVAIGVIGFTFIGASVLPSFT